jgi:predicted nucleic acid-binding protein
LSGPLVYIDTNVFIAGFELPLEQAEPVQNLLVRLRERPRLAVTSELTLGELLAPVSRKEALPFTVKRNLSLNLLVRSRIVDLRPITRDILIETADLRQHAPHRLPDAIHVVTAVQSGCSYFLSGDKGIKPPSGMTLVYPDRSGVDLILDTWSGQVQAPR